MSTVIRAADRNRPVRGVPFNFDDLAVQAEQYLAKARAEAEGIVADARRQADAIRTQAQHEGHQAAIEAVEEMVRNRLATAMPALGKAVEDIQHAKQAWLAHWQSSAVHLATAIAERLIRRELPRHPEITLALVREALELAAGSAHLEIHINPDDHRAMGNQITMLVDELAALAEAELVPDANITPGGCRVETRFGVIDQQFESQLKRIEEELT